MRVAVVGAGAVGARAARQLVSSDEVEQVLVADVRADRAGAVAASLGAPASTLDPTAAAVIARDVDAVVLAGPPGTHGALARRCLRADIHVVSSSDAVADVEALLALDHEAAERGRVVVAGAGFSPGLSCVLARHLGGLFDAATEVHVARTGDGGPACARHHESVLAGRAREWRDGNWDERRAGTGRELVWFPEPIGALDCFRAVAPDPELLARALPTVERSTVRVAGRATDRVAARLPWRPRLRRPPEDGGIGALRVEVRGRRGEARSVEVYGAVDRPAVAGGTVVAVACVWAVVGRLERTGAGGLGELADPVPLLAELARRGIKAAVLANA